MNILVLCYEYPPLGGGGGVGAQQYAEAWTKKGHNVTVLTSGRRGLPHRENVNGVDLIRVSTWGNARATTPFISMLLYVLFGALYVLRHWRELKRNDVLNTHFAVPSGPLGLFASRVLRRPNVLTLIGGDVYDPTKKSSPHRNAVMRTVNRWVMNSADRLVAISTDTKNRARQHYGIKREIKVINYGFIPFELDLTEVRKNGSNGRYDLIAVGRLIKRKGFEYLIRSLAWLPAEIKLIIVGDGPLEAELRQLAQERGLSDRVTLVGYKPREEVFKQMLHADCFVLSSMHEGLGIVVQEAMHAGLPIVATNNGGQVDLIQERRNGILVEPGDVKALAAAVHRFYNDRQLADAVGNRNRSDIKRCFISNNCEQYISLFETLVEERGRRSIWPWGKAVRTDRSQ